mgnify:CR=1 FL=1
MALRAGSGAGRLSNTHRMARPGIGLQIPVKPCRDDPRQHSIFVGDDNPAALPADDAIAEKVIEIGPVNRAAELCRDGVGINLQIAHQALDDLAANAVIAALPDAACRNKW